MKNVISVDVEDYFHPSEVRRTVEVSKWETLPSRVEAATGAVLELLAARGVQGTFFVLGWVARRHPRLLGRIAAAGHEIGCHSHMHSLVYDLTPDEFRADTLDAVRAVEDAAGCSPKAYRAPSFSITERSLWALEILVELGFTHDSSIYPIRHDRYGIPGFGPAARRVETPAGPILEVPPATAALNATRLTPVGGGGYLRLLPYGYTSAGIRWINGQEGRPACVYFHPWEMDAGQPRLAGGTVARLRTYLGLHSMAAKLERLLGEFEFDTLTRVFPALPDSANGPPQPPCRAPK